MNGTDVDNYMDANFTVKAGSQVSVEGNTNDYTLESFKVNGSSVDFYGSCSFMVTGPTTVDIVARKLGNLKAVFDIDDASTWKSIRAIHIMATAWRWQRARTPSRCPSQHRSSP